MYDTSFASTKLLLTMRTLPGPSNPKGLTQFRLSICRFAHGIILNVESGEAALAGCLLPSGATARATGFSSLLTERMLTKRGGKMFP